MGLAEVQRVPTELEGFRWVLTGYHWKMLGDFSEAECCFRKPLRPEDVPGAYFGLMNCNRLNNTARAIEYAELYEQAVGPTPELCEIKARMFEELHRSEQAVKEWEKVLRAQPENEAALRALLHALPQDDKSALGSWLARLEDPLVTLPSLAQSIAWQDYKGLLSLGSYLKNSAPDAPATQYVLGLANYQDREYQEAAKYYRRAFKSEQDSAAISKYVDAYVEAMSQIGQGVAAWREVPDPKSAFDSVAYSYEEEESLLSPQEFHQLVELYRHRFPNVLDGYYYASQIAAQDHRYDDAAEILRAGLAQSKAGPDDGDSEQSVDWLATRLASVLYESGKLQEAYEVSGDRKQRFTQLCYLASSDQNWDDVRTLMTLHVVHQPDDPQLNYFAGELAAEEERWDEAIDELKQGLEKQDDNGGWMFKHRLREIAVESDRWLEYYRSSEEQEEVFDSFAHRFVSHENWQALDALIAEHRQRWPADIQIIKHQADVSWHRKNYRAYVEQAEKLLACKDEDVIGSYQRSFLEKRVLGELLRNRAANRAHDFARKMQKRSNNSSGLAIVAAARGNFSEAEELAGRAAAEGEDAATFYTDEDVGPIFLSKPFGKFQNDHPVEVAHDLARTSVGRDSMPHRDGLPHGVHHELRGNTALGCIEAGLRCVYRAEFPCSGSLGTGQRLEYRWSMKDVPFGKSSHRRMFERIRTYGRRIFAGRHHCRLGFDSAANNSDSCREVAARTRVEP